MLYIIIARAITQLGLSVCISFAHCTVLARSSVWSQDPWDY